eukprot:02870_6
MPERDAHSPRTERLQRLPLCTGASATACASTGNPDPTNLYLLHHPKALRARHMHPSFALAPHMHPSFPAQPIKPTRLFDLDPEEAPFSPLPLFLLSFSLSFCSL